MMLSTIQEMRRGVRAKVGTWSLPGGADVSIYSMQVRFKRWREWQRSARGRLLSPRPPPPKKQKCSRDRLQQQMMTPSTDVAHELLRVYSNGLNDHKDRAFGMGVNGDLCTFFTPLMFNAKLCELNDVLASLKAQAMNDTSRVLNDDVPLPLQRVFKVYINRKLPPFLTSHMLSFLDRYKCAEDLLMDDAHVKINEDVEKATRGLIPMILEEPLFVHDLLTQPPNTLLVAAVADYIKAEWYYQFDPERTCMGYFTDSLCVKRSVAIMYRSSVHHYCNPLNGYKMLILDTVTEGAHERVERTGEKLDSFKTPFRMVLVLPGPRTSANDTLLRLGQADTLCNAMRACELTEVNVCIPKIKQLDSGIVNMNDRLKCTPSVFSDVFNDQQKFEEAACADAVDWSKFDLSFPDTNHKCMLALEMRTACVLKMEESGFEAAAVAMQSVEYRSCSTSTPSFVVNRPFVFFIVYQDARHVKPYFAGVVNGTDENVFYTSLAQ